jgi:hypothetical protein
MSIIGRLRAADGDRNQDPRELRVLGRPVHLDELQVCGTDKPTGE